MNVPSNPRTDLPFLRRRIKPGRGQADTPAAAQSAASPPAPSLSLAPGSPARTPSVPAQRSAGLNLRSNAPSSSTNARMQKLEAQREKASREDHEVQLLFKAPGIAEVFELNLDERVLRLSALESAVGTMVIGGSTAVAWESVRHVTGGQTVDGHKAGSAVMTSGNRELVAYQGRDVLITLRHVRELRRAIFINRSSAPMGVRLFSSQTVALPPATDGTQIVLLVHRVGNVLELRAEPVPHDWPDNAIWQEFDFSMTHKAPASAYGR